MFEFIDKIKDRYRQNRVEKLLKVQKSLCEIEERIEELSKAQSHKYIRKEPDGKGGWNYIYEEDKKVSNKKEENDIIILNKDENILINDAYYLRFQDDTKIQTSVHPYPTKEIINLYRNQDKVKEAIKRVDNGEIEWDDLLNFYDTEDFRFKEGYVASLRFDNENEIKVTNQNFQTAPSASDKYVMLFEGDYEDEYNIFDGIVTKMKNIKAIYEKSKDGYKLIEKDGKKVKINNITEKSFSNDYISELAQLKLNKNKLLKSEQSLKNEDPLFKSMYDHMKFEATYKEVTKGYRQGQINLDRCDEILKAINNDKKVKYSDNLVFNSEGKLLLLKRSELDKTFPGMYTIPGGHVDAGEDHRTAAIRELQEESGLTPDKDSQFTKVGEYEDDKVCIEYFRSLVDKDNDTLTLQSEEAWQYEWVDPRELDKYEFPLNMKQNIQKILYPSKEVIVKLGKAYKSNKINKEQFIEAINILNKSQFNHKYIDKKLDKFGNFYYIYKKNQNSLNNDKTEEKRVDKGQSSIEQLSQTEKQTSLFGSREDVEKSLLIGEYAITDKGTNGEITIPINFDKSLQSINELYLQNRISDELYETIIEKAWKKSPIGTIVTRSNGQKWKKVSETGNKDQDWQLVGKPKTGNKTDEPVSKEKRAEYGTKGEQPTISEHAKESSETALNNAIKQSDDPKIREAAHQEIDRREKEEKVQEEPGKKEDRKTNKEEKKTNNEVKGLDKLNETLKNDFEKVSKELMDFSDYSDNKKLKELTIRKNWISNFLQKINNVSSDNLEEAQNKLKKYLNFDGDLKTVFGDGKILAMNVNGNPKTVFSAVCVMEDGFTARMFKPDSKEVMMHEFHLNPSIKTGEGKGTEIFLNQVEQFKKLGYEKLITDAEDGDYMNGFYTWARLGYDMTNDWEINALKDVLEDSEDKDFKNIKSLSDLMSTKKGRDFWRNKGFKFTGSFDMTDGSKNMNTLKKYKDERGIGRNNK